MKKFLLFSLVAMMMFVMATVKVTSTELPALRKITSSGLISTATVES